MKLTTLNIKGFKSFPDKTSIHFTDSITGVVGPNGSGKSNIIDAIRWVLGEQKTSMLRSEKMDNLIFNGSKGRKASGMAEVSLTFENNRGVIPSEFKDITVTRILHRSGESEYRINSVPCRLKDITGLFMDTGISTDSYAIIELKMVAEILDNTDNSRRKLFEQAAGISKYKKRKKETLNKLSATDGDLDRVEDLLFEISNNLKTLESQARKARKYQKLKEEYKTFSIELAILRLAQYKNSLGNIKDQQQSHEDKKLEIDTNINKVEATIEKGKTDLIEKEKHLSSRQKEVNELLNDINKKESDKKLAAEQKKFLEEKIQNLEEQVKTFGIKIETLSVQSKELAEKEEEQEKVTNELEKEVATEKGQLEAIREENNTLKEQLDKRQSEKQNRDQLIHDLEKRLAVNSTQKENLTRSASQNLSKNSEISDILSKLQTDRESNKKELDAKTKEVEKLVKTEGEIATKVEETISSLEQTKLKLSEENRKLDSTRNQYNLNKSLIDNLEGFPESIKFLKKNAPKTKEFQLLSDVIYCKEEHRVTIENFLEPFLNYFIVNNPDEARESIGLLSDASIGRANFFILDNFNDFKAPKPNAKTIAKPAIQLVETDKKYEQLTAFLLKDVYMAPADVADDEALFKELKGTTPDAILLSANGKYIRSKFTMSGGAVGLFEGMRLGRVKNLEKLQSEIAKLEKQIASTEKQLQKYQAEIDELKAKSNRQIIENEKEALSQLRSQSASLNTKIEHYESFIGENKEKNTSIETRIKEIETQDQKDEAALLELTEQKQQADLDIQQLQTKYQEVNQKLSVTSNEYNQKNIEFHQQKNKLQSIKQEKVYNNNQVEELNHRLADNNKEISDAKEKIVTLNHREKELEEALIKAYENKEQFESGLSDVESAYYKSKGDINELEQQLRELQKARNNAETLITSVKDKSTEIKIELNSLKERLSVEFNLNVNDLINREPEDDWDEEEISEKVEKIRRRLENFGEINPMAVEAFDEMKERFDFITAQKGDLESAKQSLLETIDEIEETAKQKFLEAFEQIRTNFQAIFKSFFSEDDHCDLILTNPESPLEADIEIIAQPKGKQPLSINQLSGGEKSLTALSILFAMYLLKPAPFCILDEVDAPLDDTNIGKFNETIKTFSKDSQFILVTHNKETMSSVDVIYGVTMPENGVSRVVPVDFRNLN